MKKASKKAKHRKARQEIQRQQPFCPVNSEGVEKIPVTTLRWLHTYGFRLIGSRVTGKYAMFGRDNKLAYGEGYTLGLDDIETLLMRQRRENPIYLPDGAEGVIFPGLLEKCKLVYKSGLGNYHLIQRLIATYPNEYAFALVDWRQLQTDPKTCSKSHVELDEIIRRIFNQIRSDRGDMAVEGQEEN